MTFKKLKPIRKMRLTQKVTLAFLLFGCILMFAMIPIRENETAFHTPEELANFTKHSTLFTPVDSSILFPTASVCEGCHGFDPQMNAYVDNEGNDVNIFDDWSATMMANSAKDPFWRAKVSHEMLVNPNHSLDLQTKCTSCHAPNGHFTATLRGATHYTMDEMLSDTIALDGVNCATCHKISPDGLAETFSGVMRMDTNRVVYGPYEFPFAAPMADFVGFEPLFSDHVHDAGMCASCHSLITNSVDLQGEYTGETFVEQATYHEWLNSSYNTPSPITSTTCQNCHMPSIEDSIVIASNLLFLQGRTPFALHDLVGANTFMLELMKNNKEALGVKASDAAYDETIMKTMEMLQQQSVDLKLNIFESTQDTAFFSVEITNKTGHKFPSGYPSRRAFIELVVVSEMGDTLFASGLLQPDYEVVGQDDEKEDHYNIITQEDQVQIYELVLGDVNGDFTTVLERSHMALKDNRLPPLGFTTSHEVYDTCRIYGNALTDADFNMGNGVEGNGKDIVHYHIPMEGYAGLVTVSAKVFYQALPPKWMAPMFAESTPEIDAFRDMFYETDNTPVLVAAEMADSVPILLLSPTLDLQEIDIQVYPNPTQDGIVFISKNESLDILNIQVFDALGRLVKTYSSEVTQIQLPQEEQVFFIEIRTQEGTLVKKIILQK